MKPLDSPLLHAAPQTRCAVANDGSGAVRNSSEFGKVWSQLSRSDGEDTADDTPQIEARVSEERASAEDSIESDSAPDSLDSQEQVYGGPVLMPSSDDPFVNRTEGALLRPNSPDSAPVTGQQEGTASPKTLATDLAQAARGWTGSIGNRDEALASTDEAQHGTPALPSTSSSEGILPLELSGPTAGAFAAGTAKGSQSNVLGQVASIHNGGSFAPSPQSVDAPSARSVAVTGDAAAQAQQLSVTPQSGLDSSILAGGPRTSSVPRDTRVHSETPLASPPQSAGPQTRLPRPTGAAIARFSPISKGNIATSIQSVKTQLFDSTSGGGRFDAQINMEGLSLSALAVAPATNAPTATLPIPATTQAAVAQQIASSIAHSGGMTTEIALNPEELGRVRISLTTTESGMSVSIISERPETTDLMRRHIDVLAREFAELGYDNLAFSFDTPRDEADDNDPNSDATTTASDPHSIDVDANILPIHSAAPAGGLDLKL